MPKIAITEEILNDNFTKIHLSDMDIEPVLLLYAPPIDYIKPSKLLNIMNIPTTEYSQELDSSTNMQLYIDDILANHHNRNIAQFSIVQDRIDKLGGYNNGKLEFDDNAIEGLLQITIELLEIINSNFNDLLGLVSVNNFLLGMMGTTGITGTTEEYVTKGQLDEMEDNFNQLVKDKTNPNPIDVFLTALGAAGLAGGIVEPLVAPLPLQIAVILGYYMYKYRPETPPTGKEPSNYLTGGGGHSSGNGGSNYPANPNYNSLKEKDNNLKDMSTQQLDPLTETAFKVESQQMVKMLDFNNDGYQINQTQDIFRLLGVDGDENAFTRLFGTVMLSNANEMQEQGNGDLLKATSETEEFFKTFTQVIEKTSTTDLAEIYTTINNPNSDSSDKWDTVYKTDKLYDNSNAYVKPILHNDTYENKTNTNAITIEDLKNYTHNLNNVIPPKVENTYEIQVTNNFKMNITKDVDYEDITRYVTRSISNEILGVKAVLF